MTIESKVYKNTYKGNGSTTAFDFTFKVWSKDEVQVLLNDGTTETDVTSKVTITVEETTEKNGTVTFSAAPTTGMTIAILRSMPFTQTDTYVSGSRFDASEIEDALDQACAERQQLKEELSRCLKIGPTQSDTDTVVIAEKVLEAASTAEQAATTACACATRAEDADASAADSATAADMSERLTKDLRARCEKILALVLASQGSFIDQNTSSSVKVWYGTLAEYNALGTIYDNWEYNILERAIIA